MSRTKSEGSGTGKSYVVLCNLSMPKDVRDKITRNAEKHGLSRSRYAVMALRMGMKTLHLPQMRIPRNRADLKAVAATRNDSARN